MEGIFTLPYSEYQVINQLQKKLAKSDGNSYYIPVSRQQKGIDFIIHNNLSNKIIRIQVKSSRSYFQKPKKLKSGKIRDVKYKYHLWFNNFLDKYEKNNADYYILFGLYPVYQQNKNIKSKSIFWENLILCFSEKEMIKLLKKVRTKRKKKPDKFFSFGFNNGDEIFGTRGFKGNINLSKFLLENKLKELKRKLK